MKSAPPSYKHDNPTYSKFGQSGDSSLLRKGFADGGSVGADLGVLRSREVRQSDRGVEEVQGLAEGGSVDDDFYKAGWNAYKNLYADIAAPQTEAIADAKAEDAKAIAKGLSNDNKD